MGHSRESFRMISCELNIQWSGQGPTSRCELLSIGFERGGDLAEAGVLISITHFCFAQFSDIFNIVFTTLQFFLDCSAFGGDECLILDDVLYFRLFGNDLILQFGQFIFQATEMHYDDRFAECLHRFFQFSHIRGIEKCSWSLSLRIFSISSIIDAFGTNGESFGYVLPRYKGSTGQCPVETRETYCTFDVSSSRLTSAVCCNGDGIIVSLSKKNICRSKQLIEK